MTFWNDVTRQTTWGILNREVRNARGDNCNSRTGKGVSQSVRCINRTKIQDSINRFGAELLISTEEDDIMIMPGSTKQVEDIDRLDIKLVFVWVLWWAELMASRHRLYWAVKKMLLWIVSVVGRRTFLKTFFWAFLFFFIRFDWWFCTCSWLSPHSLR